MLQQAIPKCSHTFGILAAPGFLTSSVTTQPHRIFAIAITKGSATGTPLSLCCSETSCWKWGTEKISATNANSFAVGTKKYLLICIYPIIQVLLVALAFQFFVYLTHRKDLTACDGYFKVFPKSGKSLGEIVAQYNKAAGVKNVDH